MRLIISFLLSLLIVFHPKRHRPLRKMKHRLHRSSNSLIQAKTPKMLRLLKHCKALSWINEARDSDNKAKSYQDAIDNFLKLSKQSAKTCSMRPIHRPQFLLALA